MLASQAKNQLLGINQKVGILKGSPEIQSVFDACLAWLLPKKLVRMVHEPGQSFS